MYLAVLSDASGCALAGVALATGGELAAVATNTLAGSLLLFAGGRVGIAFACANSNSEEVIGIGPESNVGFGELAAFAFATSPGTCRCVGGGPPKDLGGPLGSGSVVPGLNASMAK